MKGKPFVVALVVFVIGVIGIASLILQESFPTIVKALLVFPTATLVGGGAYFIADSKLSERKQVASILLLLTITSSLLILAHNRFAPSRNVPSWYWADKTKIYTSFVPGTDSFGNDFQKMTLEIYELVKWQDGDKLYPDGTPKLFYLSESGKGQKTVFTEPDISKVATCKLLPISEAKEYYAEKELIKKIEGVRQQALAKEEKGDLEIAETLLNEAYTLWQYRKPPTVDESINRDLERIRKKKRDKEVVEQHQAQVAPEPLNKQEPTPKIENKATLKPATVSRNNNSFTTHRPEDVAKSNVVEPKIVTSQPVEKYTPPEPTVATNTYRPTYKQPNIEELQTNPNLTRNKEQTVKPRYESQLTIESEPLTQPANKLSKVVWEGYADYKGQEIIVNISTNKVDRGSLVGELPKYKTQPYRIASLTNVDKSVFSPTSANGDSVFVRLYASDKGKISFTIRW